METGKSLAGEKARSVPTLAVTVCVSRVGVALGGGGWAVEAR